VYSQIFAQDNKLDVKTVQAQYKEYQEMYNEEMDNQAKNN
jgi:hypothetical protein